MAKGSPDHTKRTRMQGLDGTTLRTIAVDVDGQLYTLLKGEHGGVYVPLQLDENGNIVAVIQGTDGSALRTVRTDVAGRLINVIRDPSSNNYVSVDADGHLTTVMKGAEGATLRTLAVDPGGRMISLIRDPTSGNYVAVNSDGFMSMIMKGIEGGTLRTVAVDEDGNLTGVFKGEFEGSLKTLATDTDGRLMAIMTDPENLLGVRPVVGGAELAARLGSCNSYERRGTVVYMNDISKGASMGTLTHSGVGSDCFITAAPSRTSGYSIALQCGSAGGSYGQFEDYFGVASYAGRVGFEFHATIDGGQALAAWQINLHDGTNVHLFAIKWDMNDGKLYYKNAANNWVDSGDVFLPYGYDTEFIPIKLVMDIGTGNYLRLYVGGELFDWSTFEGYTAASGTAPSCAIAVSFAEDGDGTSRTIYLCDMIVTVQEDET